MEPAHAAADRQGRARRSWRGSLPDGGFNIYAGGPAEVSATVKAYFALKLAGVRRRTTRALARARERILALGGIQAANSYVKINLSLFGLYPREHCPIDSAGDDAAAGQLPLPDVVAGRAPSWCRSRSCTRSTPARPVPAGFTLEELFLPGVSPAFRRSRGAAQLAQPVPRRSTGLLKFWEKHGAAGVRRRAIRAAEQWMLERLAATPTAWAPSTRP